MIRRYVFVVCIGLLLITTLAGCNAQAKPISPPATPTPEAGTELPTPVGPTPAAGDIAARVNGQPISRQEYERQVAQFQAAMISQGQSFSGEEGKPLALQVRRQVLEAMIDEVLIAQAAAARGIVVSEAVLRQRVQSDIEAGGGQQKFEAWLRANHLTVEEYEQAIRSQIITDELVRQLALSIPETSKQIHVRQILVRDERQANDLRRQLDRGADFSDLAKKFSIDEGTRAEGGDRGFLPLGMSLMPAEVEQVVAGMAPGQIAGPVATPHGFYLIQVVEIDENRALAPEMRQGITRDAFIQWVEGQRAQAKIERFVDLD